MGATPVQPNIGLKAKTSVSAGLNKDSSKRDGVCPDEVWLPEQGNLLLTASRAIPLEIVRGSISAASGTMNCAGQAEEPGWRNWQTQRT